MQPYHSHSEMNTAVSVGDVPAPEWALGGSLLQPFSLSHLVLTGLFLTLFSSLLCSVFPFLVFREFRHQCML